ncbi:MAG: HYR domain-containing protein [Ghiorsea sp.]
MLKIIKLLSMFTLSVGLLTACGGSGGSSTTAPSTTGTTTPTSSGTATPPAGGTTDSVSPIVSAPANISVIAALGATTVAATQSAIATFLSAATATDNVGVVGAITNDVPANFPVGVTTVTFTAKDAANNSGTATATVTVNAAATGGGGSTVTLNASSFCPVNPPAVVAPTLNGWSWANPKPQGASLQTAVEGNGVFLAGGDSGQLLRSTDKITWSIVDSGTRSQISKIYWDGSAFIMPVGTSVKISCDGLHWSTQSVAVTNGVTNDISAVFMANKYYAFSGNSMFQSTDAVNWVGSTITTVTGLGTFASISKAANNGTTFVAEVSNPSAYIVSNDAGATWQTVATPPTQTKYLIWNGSQFVALSTSGAQLSTSSDGLTWVTTTVTLPIAFSTLYSPHLIYFGGVATLYGGNDFTQISSYNNNGGFYTLSAVNAWTEADWNDTTSQGLLKINSAIVTATNTLLIVGDGGLIAEQTGANIPLLNAANNKSWIRHAGESAALLTSVASSGTSYVAVGLGATILYSTDGFTWSRPSIPTYKFAVWSQPTPITNYGKVVWTGLEYLAYAGGGAILTSVDGLTWVVEKNPSGSTNSGPTVGTYFNNTYISGTYTRTAANTYGSINPAVGATLAAGATIAGYGGYADNGTRLVAVGNFGISTSLNTTTWTLANLSNVANSANFDFMGVAYNGSKFIAAANYATTDPITNFVTNNEIILESTDGLTWTKITIFPNGSPNLRFNSSNTPRNVLRSGSGKFIGFRPGTSDPLESLDGATWADVLTPRGTITMSPQTGSTIYKPTGSYYGLAWGDYLKTPTREILIGFRNGIIVK